MLRTTSAAPTTSTADNAISLTTKTERSRRCPRPAEAEREPAFNESCVDDREDCTAPSAPKITPLTSATPMTTPSVVRSNALP
jgi:hypothetical protein